MCSTAVESKKQILVVEDAEPLRKALAEVLGIEGYAVREAASAEEALGFLRTEEFSLVLSDLRLPGESGLAILRESKAMNKKVPVVVMTAFGCIETAVEAMQLGAQNFITKPFEPSRLCSLVHEIFKSQPMEATKVGVRNTQRTIITQSPAMEELLLQVKKVAPLSSPVLLLGESGTGKELIARSLHNSSLRAEQEFVAVNCGSIPAELMESELFGHEAGAFTGAFEQHKGLFETANGGTIFLDEISTMPSDLQTKLLRTLQENEIRRVGSNKLTKIDARIVSATNSQVDEEIRSGKFREDLYYRLGVVVLEIPPLRKRPEDIELLANYFLKRFSQQNNRETAHLTVPALKLLREYSWPGNVRELENVIERAVVFHDGPITAESLALNGPKTAPTHSSASQRSLPELAQEALQRCETEAIHKALVECKQNKSRAAKLLGVSYKTLLNKIRDYAISGT